MRRTIVFFGAVASVLAILIVLSGKPQAAPTRLTELRNRQSASPDLPQKPVLDSRATPSAARISLSGNAVIKDTDVEYKSDQIIVSFKSSASEAEIAAAVAPIGKIEETIGDSDVAIVHLKKGTSVKQADATLKQSPTVAYAEPDYVVHTCETIPSDTDFSKLWNLKNTGQTGGTSGADIKATTAWDTTTGSTDVIVAVIDTGIDYTHTDLAGNVWTNAGEMGIDAQGRDMATNNLDDDHDGYIDDVRGWCFAYGWADPVLYKTVCADPLDDHGHGTHVSGIIGACGNNGFGITGVNWNVKIMPLKFLEWNGSGLTSDAVKAIRYAQAHGADIINNSWGGGGYSQALQDAVNDATGAGCLVVGAAGNENSEGLFYPADLENVLTVAATDHNDTRASYSNFGPFVDVAAPGSRIYSTLPTFETFSLGDNHGYGTLSGTSMACPSVSGVAALLKSRYPDASPADLQYMIEQTADDKGAPGWDQYYGYGRINAAAALQAGQTKAAISSPVDSGVAKDVVAITGTATGPRFASFKLEWGAGTTPAAWHTVTSSATPVSNGSLGSWDATGLSGGIYELRLTVTDLDGHDVVAVAHVTVPRTPEPPMFTTGSVWLRVNQYCNYGLQVMDYNLEPCRVVIDWGDGTTTTTRLYAFSEYMMSVDFVQADHTWTAAGAYFIKARTVNADGETSSWSSPVEIDVGAPITTPGTPFGKTHLPPNTTRNYFAWAQDLFYRDLKLVFDWGDGTPQTSTTFYNVDWWMGSALGTSHTWAAAGTYALRVKTVAADGESSAWSDPLSMIITGANNLPNAPAMQGSSTAAPDVEARFTLSNCGDADQDEISYTIDWGDGTTTSIGDYPYNYCPFTSHIWTATGSYSIKVKATDSYGQTSDWGPPTSVTVAAANHPPTVPVVTGYVNAYTGELVGYTTTSDDPDQNRVTYVFDWGDGTSTTSWAEYPGFSMSQAHAWTAPGVYPVRVKATDATGLVSAWSAATWVTVRLEAPPAPGIPELDQYWITTYFKGVSVNFSTATTDGAGRPMTYVFDWGDGTTDTSFQTYSGGTVTLAHTWTAPGLFQVKAKAITQDGRVSAWSNVNEIHIIDHGPTAPAALQGDIRVGQNLTGSFNTSSSDPEGDQIQYTFDWGDGTTSKTGWLGSGSTAAATHTWTTKGTYTVRLRAMDQFGARSTISTATVYVFPADNVAPVKPATPSGTASMYTATPATYTSSTTDGNVDQLIYTFDWGDGTTTDTNALASGAAASASHSWPASGVYAVKVKATDIYNTASVWSSTLSVTILTRAPGTPSNLSGTSAATVGLEYSYRARSSDPEHQDIQYLFDWGDGTTTTTRYYAYWEYSSNIYGTATHVWPAGGAYLVKVKAIDSTGAASGWCSSLNITAHDSTPLTPAKPQGPLAVELGASGSFSAVTTDPDNHRVKYVFDWGDGGTDESALLASGGVGATLSHTWNLGGTYQVKVRAVDELGVTSGWSPPASVFINQAPMPPASAGGPSLGITGQSYSFNTAGYDPDDDRLAFTFDWGDGTTSTSESVESRTEVSMSHAWASAGLFTIKIRSTDVWGLSSGWAMEDTVIQICGAPDVPLAPSGSASVLFGQSVGYAAASRDPAGRNVCYTFDWGDGTTETTAAVSSGTLVSVPHIWQRITAAATEEYDVRVRAANDLGAVSVWSQPKRVAVRNELPGVPARPDGPVSANPGDELTYTTVAQDANGDSLTYVFDWGDGTTSETAGVSSGATASLSHHWPTGGEFAVKVRVGDASTDGWTGWSEALTVGINHAPGIPNIVGGPTGFAKRPVSVSALATDLDGDGVGYTFDWGDGTSGSTGTSPSGMAGEITHIWNEVGVYTVLVKATDARGAKSETSLPLRITINQTPLPVPLTPTGPAAVVCNTRATYTAVLANRLIFEPIRFVFAWGDGSTTTTRFYTTAEIFNMWPAIETHTWSLAGNYETKVETVVANGTVSGWSQPTVVTVR